MTTVSLEEMEGTGWMAEAELHLRGVIQNLETHNKQLQEDLRKTKLENAALTSENNTQRSIIENLKARGEQCQN